jgi:hypothetical protein
MNTDAVLIIGINWGAIFGGGVTVNYEAIMFRRGKCWGNLEQWGCCDLGVVRNGRGIVKPVNSVCRRRKRGENGFPNG